MKPKLELLKTQLEQTRIFNTTSSFNKFEIEKYYQNESRFIGVYLRKDLPKIKDGTYFINLDEYKSKGIHWISLDANLENVTYFDSFGVEHIPKEIKKNPIKIHVKPKIYRVQAYD